ncbi:hypothetical protein [Curtobacterium sp. MCBD17_030]|uniref:hypothetical protein n=1 Tax=Curtobacterium sp. MCBD17_030 TaxID=2175649 RepID=UPI000D95A9FB|nr:hypothetical protein [Curtobacterium sp. MCBD17_030]PYY33681.1 hypothetical protein DEI89_10070 [Curtobacterium sp. MCBD17_030]
MEPDIEPTAGGAAPSPRRPACGAWIVAPALVVLIGSSIAFGLQPLQIANEVSTPVVAVYEHLLCGMLHAVNDIADTGSSCH